MTLQITTVKGNLLVKGGFEIKDRLKALPASKFNKTAKAWVYPATVGAARNLMQLTQYNGVTIDGDAGFNSLRDFVVLQNQAQAVKVHRCNETCPQWHHQGEAIRFMRHLPAGVLNMGTGTGKTKTTIDLIDLRGHRFVLVITKKKAVSVWKKDVAKFLGADAMNVVQLDTGSVAKNLKLAQAAVADTSKPIILVTNYQSVWRDVFAKWILKQPIDLLVLDESHSIKAPGGKASIFLKRLRKGVPCVVALTATFFGDKPIDVYGQMRTIDPAVLGTSFKAFKEEYCYLGGYTGREIIGYRNQDQLAEKLAPYLFQVDKSVLKLIPVREKRYYCKLPAATQAIYNKFSEDGYVGFKHDDNGKPVLDRSEDAPMTVRVDNPLTKLLRQQQIACGFITPDDSTELVHFDTSKIDTLEEILTDLPDMEDVPQHTPVVIYCRFKQDLLNIKAVAQKLGYTYGEISGDIDQQEDFKSGKINLLGCQINAGGTGVDGLQEVAHIAVYYSTGHSLVEYLQSLGRLDRPGQTYSVLNIYIVAENTVDEDIVQALINKEDVIEFLNKKLQNIAASVK
jgi:superfamily II DNA or RNA helicase